MIETGITGELPFYVMTYVEGEPLRKMDELVDANWKIWIETWLKATLGNWVPPRP